jgi:succinate-acetate transporter protein
MSHEPPGATMVDSHRGEGEEGVTMATVDTAGSTYPATPTPPTTPTTPTAPTGTAQAPTGPLAPPEPRGVLVGAGGDPLIVGLVFFGIAALALGMSLVGRPTGALGSILPILIMGAGLYQLVTTVWAILLGQSMVAAIFSTFSAFWLSFGALLLGINHGWFGLTSGDATGAQELFFIAWACLFLLLVIPVLMLPAVYPLAVFLVFVACALSAASAFTGSENLSIAAGATALTFAFLAFWAWVHVALKAMGGPAWPPLGEPALRYMAR